MQSESVGVNGADGPVSCLAKVLFAAQSGKGEPRLGLHCFMHFRHLWMGIQVERQQLSSLKVQILGCVLLSGLN